MEHLVEQLNLVKFDCHSNLHECEPKWNRKKTISTPTQTTGRWNARGRQFEQARAFTGDVVFTHTLSVFAILAIWCVDTFIGWSWMRDTCDEMVYLSCLHQLSVLVSFSPVFGKHHNNAHLRRALETWPLLHELPVYFATYGQTDK